MLDTILFYSFALLTLVGAILTVSLRNAVYCAIALVTSLAGVAGLYLLQKAEFLFAVQIVLYIGGITVLFLFVIMLVNLDQTAHQPRYHRHWLVPRRFPDARPRPAGAARAAPSRSGRQRRATGRHAVPRLPGAV